MVKAIRARQDTPVVDEPGGLFGWFSRWRSATRQAETRAKATTPSPPSKPAKQPRTKISPLLLEVDPLYLVHGVDGVLRGAPDPTMVVCAWALGDNGVQTVLRSVVRFDVKDGVPGPAAPDVRRLKSTAVSRNAPVLLFVALFEENRGDDVRRLTAALEHPEHLHFVELGDGGTPHVVSADEAFADASLATLAVRGVVLADGADPSRTTTDTWVGGAALVVKQQHKARRDHRINLRTVDGTQDWIVSIATSRA